MREVQSANFSQALQGRLPGVELTQTSSQPGGTMQIRIRGSRSLTASNDPLIVLDGIPFVGTINDINPNRSEEHTSELQSLMRISYAVICLKKKKHNNNITM